MSPRHVTAVVLLSGATTAPTPQENKRTPDPTAAAEAETAARVEEILAAVAAQDRAADRVLVTVPPQLPAAATELLAAAQRAGRIDRMLPLGERSDQAAAVRAVLELLREEQTTPREDEGAPRTAVEPDADRGPEPGGRRAAAVDAEEVERERSQRAADLARVPERLREQTPGPGAGRRAAPAGGDSWLWFAVQDAPPAPDALGRELELVVSSPNTAVVGAKRLRPPRPAETGAASESQDPAAPAELVDVGLTLTHSGRIITGVDPGEIDQGQADWRHDVLAVALPGMLVRTRTLLRSGGLDGELPSPWAEIDLCHRIWRSGERVAVQPEAAVVLAPPTRPLLERLQEQRTGRLLVLLKHRGPVAALLLLAALPLVTLARMAGAVAAVVPRRAGMEARAWVDAMRSAPAVIRRGARAGRRARVPRGRLAPLYLPRGESLRRGLADVWTRLVADDDRTRRIRRTTWGIAGTRHGVDDADYGRHVIGTVVVALAGTVLGLLALRGLFGRGTLQGPALLPLPESWRDTVAAAWSSWIPTGLGERGPADPLLRVLGALPLGGDLWAEALVFAAVPASALTAWWAAGALTRAIGARLALVVTWALAPALLSALSLGAWPLLLVHVLLPLLALAVGRAIGLPHKVSQASVPAAAAGGLLLLVIGAVQPALVVLVALALAMLAPLVPGRRPRLLWVLVPSLLLHLPYIPAYLAHPSMLLGVGAVPAGSLPVGDTADLLRLWPTAPGLDAVLAPLLGAQLAPWAPALALLPVVLGALAAPLLAGTAGTAGRYGLLLAALAGAAVLLVVRVPLMPAGDAVIAAPLHGLLDLLLLALCLGAGASFDALARRGAGVSRPRRALTAAVAGLVAAVCVVTVAGWSLLLPGMLAVDRAEGSQVPAAATDQGLTDARSRVLVLGETAEGTVTASLVVQGADTALQQASVTDARDLELLRLGGELGSDAGSEALREDVAEMLATGDDAGPEAAAVAYVVVPGAAEDHPALVSALDASTALEKVTETADGGLWRVIDTHPRAEIRGEDGTVPLASGVIDAEGTIAAADAERTLVLSERADADWRATVDGERLEPVTVDGWAQGFTVPADAAGQVEVHRVQPLRLLWQLLLLAGVVVTALIAIPWRMRARSAEELYG